MSDELFSDEAEAVARNMLEGAYCWNFDELNRGAQTALVAAAYAVAHSINTFDPSDTDDRKGEA